MMTDQVIGLSRDFVYFTELKEKPKELKFYILQTANAGAFQGRKTNFKKKVTEAFLFMSPG